MTFLDAKFVIAIALGLMSLGSSVAFAQSSSDCAAYFDAIASGNAKVPAVVPDRLLSDATIAVPCLVVVIRSMNAEIADARKVSEGTLPRLLSATGAIRTIMARTTPSADQPNASPQSLPDFISMFRRVGDVTTASVLTYSARSDSYDLRLNSVLILGNVIDNTTVCIPLTHLNDPSLLDSPNGVKGRANLLSIVSVVAPWAVNENYNNIERTITSVRASLDSTDANLKGTLSLLDNIQARLDSQTASSNKGAWLPESARIACSQYVENFLPKLEKPDNVKYAPHSH